MIGRKVRNEENFGKRVSQVKLDEIWGEAQKFKIQQKQNEWFTFLNEIMKLDEPAKLILEIGCYDGGGTVSFSHLTEELITIDQGEVTRFDTFGYPEDSTIKGSEYIRQNCKFTYVSPDSHSVVAFNKVKEILNGRKLDVLFIDGDHSYTGAKQDFITYSELVREGGLIGMHDILRSSFHEQNSCFVHDFWDEIKLKGECTDIIDDFPIEKTNAEWGGIGLVKVTSGLLETLGINENQPTIESGGPISDNSSYLGGVNY